MENEKIETWMFRASGERLYLFLSLIFLIVIGFITYNVNFYAFSGYLLVIAMQLIMIQVEQSKYLANSIKVFESQLPDLFEVFKEQCKKLNINRASLYITQDPYLNAKTFGIGKCNVVLNSAIVEQLNRKELACVIGHELGHYKAGHTKVSSILVSPDPNNIFSNLIFGLWQRKCEYTCDNCALALTKDLDSTLSTLIKISVGEKIFTKLNIEAYTQQIIKAKNKSVALAELFSSHPFITNRIINCISFWKTNFIKESHPALT